MKAIAMATAAAMLLASPVVMSNSADAGSRHDWDDYDDGYYREREHYGRWSDYDDDYDWKPRHRWKRHHDRIVRKRHHRWVRRGDVVVKIIVYPGYPAYPGCGYCW